MASLEDCEQALATLAARLAEKDATADSDLDRSLSCTIRDLHTVFAGQLHNGQLRDIKQVDSPDAQIKLSMGSDDLVALVDGTVTMASAWATGRVRVSAGVRDMIKLRSIF